MVEGQSMTTVADVVAQVRDGRLEDFVKEAVALVARELMSAEISAEIGAELGEGRKRGESGGHGGGRLGQCAAARCAKFSGAGGQAAGDGRRERAAPARVASL